jgi:hypothetical protein
MVEHQIEKVQMHFKVHILNTFIIVKDYFYIWNLFGIKLKQLWSWWILEIVYENWKLV